MTCCPLVVADPDKFARVMADQEAELKRHFTPEQWAWLERLEEMEEE